MDIRVIRAAGTQPGPSGRPGDRVVEATAAGRGTSDRGTGTADRAETGRSVVAAGPSPSNGPRQRPGYAPAFVTHLAATGAAGLASGDRRSHRDPSPVLDRAGAAYRQTVRLLTVIEPGFLAQRQV